MSESAPQSEMVEFTCGNCGFRGNNHEMEVHAALAHMHCDDPDCEACTMKESL